jgi:hypothetical protein
VKSLIGKIGYITPQEFNVLTTHSTYQHTLLKLSEPGTPMNNYYQAKMHNNNESHVSGARDAKKTMITKKGFVTRLLQIVWKIL